MVLLNKCWNILVLIPSEQGIVLYPATSTELTWMSRLNPFGTGNSFIYKLVAINLDPVMS